MTSPEDAVRVARERAAAARAEGAYPPLEVTPSAAFEAAGDSDALLEWAVVHPQLEQTPSQRRFGFVVVGVRRALLRMLGGYLTALLGEQTRFNVHSALQIQRLEDRVAELERHAAGRSGGGSARDA